MKQKPNQNMRRRMAGFHEDGTVGICPKIWYKFSDFHTDLSPNCGIFGFLGRFDFRAHTTVPDKHDTTNWKSELRRNNPDDQNINKCSATTERQTEQLRENAMNST
jgi:hypothetical protein